MTNFAFTLTAFKERIQSDERQKQRAIKKKEKAEANRKAAEAHARAQSGHAQKLRSAAFAAARRGDAAEVRRLVWDESVNAGGGEVLDDMNSALDKKPKDGAETLLHIAAIQGNVELVEWLVKRSKYIQSRL